eukprot:gene4069-14163_t
MPRSPQALTALALFLIGAPLAAHVAAACVISLEMAHKSVDQDAGMKICLAAAMQLNTKAIPKGSNDILMFDCANVSAAGNGGKSMPIFGGLHAYHDIFGKLSIRSNSVKHEDAGVDEILKSLMQWHKDGGLKALVSEVQYPTPWLASCCADPPIVLRDSCGASVGYGQWLPSCPNCTAAV